MTVDRRRADSSVGEGAPERGLEVGLKLAISDRSTAKEEALSSEVKGRKHEKKKTRVGKTLGDFSPNLLWLRFSTPMW